MCTAEQLQCVSSIKVDKSECLQQCSGLLVTSFDKNEIEDRPVEIANALVDKLTKFMSESHYLFQDMAKNFKGFCIKIFCYSMFYDLNYEANVAIVIELGKT